MFVTNTHNERGDTLIEVILALSVFAIIAVSAFAILNKGVAQMYDSLERTQVRMGIDVQTESLTYARDQYLRKQSPLASLSMTTEDLAAAQVWSDILTVDDSSPTLNACNATNATAFYLDRSGTTLQLKRFTTGDAAVGNAFPTPGNGLYVQYRKSTSTAPIKFRDFYFTACWLPTSSPVRQSLSTVVRLYEN